MSASLLFVPDEIYSIYFENKIMIKAAYVCVRKGATQLTGAFFPGNEYCGVLLTGYLSL